MNLSAREKGLLAILLFVLFWFGVFRFLVAPSLAEINSLQNEIQQLEMQQEQKKMVANQTIDFKLPLEEEQVRKAEENYFLRNIDPVFIDRLLQKTANAHGVILFQMQIEDPAVTAVDPYYANLQVLLSPMRQQLIQMDTTAAERYQTQLQGTQGTANDTPQSVPLYSCSLEVAGPVAAVVAMVDELNGQNKSMFVSSISSPDVATNITEGLFNGNIDIQFYFLEDE